MSEPKKLEDLLQEMSNQLKDLQKWKKEQSQSTEKPTSSKQEPETAPSHSIHSANVKFDCPECEKAYVASVIEKAKPEILKAEHQAHLKLESPVMCKNCGEIVERETEECPTCHGKEAQEI